MHLSYEAWVTILLASLAVLLAMVTAVVAIAGIGIALVGIWGIRTMRKWTEQKAHQAVQEKIAEFPDAQEFNQVHADMKEMYRAMEQKLSEITREVETQHQRSDKASEILDRLTTNRADSASNRVGPNDKPADTSDRTRIASYPGEEAESDDSNTGTHIEAEGSHLSNPR